MTSDAGTHSSEGERRTKRPSKVGGLLFSLFHKPRVSLSLSILQIDRCQLTAEHARTHTHPLLWFFSQLKTDTQKRNKDISYFPTKFSSTDDFPADWPPTTAIWGKSMTMGTPSWVKASCIRLMIGMRASIPRFPAAGAVILRQLFHQQH